MRNKKEVIESVSKLKDKDPLAISTITIAEIYMNVFPAEIPTTEEFLYKHIICDVDDLTAKQGGLYWQQYTKNFSSLSLADCLIAATARTNNLTLVSLNTRHFPMKDVKVLNPLEFVK